MPQARITVSDLTMAYGDFVLQREVNFTVQQGDVFIIMGCSGCGKSTLLRHLMGLMRPARGSVFHGEINFWETSEEERARIMRSFGVSYQGGALWSAMTLVENIAIPLEREAHLTGAEIRDLAEFKLALVGLAGYGDRYPPELSGGMRKRAGLARAMALDPELLFFDEPTAGLDPINARKMDDLILELRDSLGATVVAVTHELSSIFAIGDDSVFLDEDEKTVIAQGNPHRLLEACDVPKVREFLTRGEEDRRQPDEQGAARNPDGRPSRARES